MKNKTFTIVFFLFYPFFLGSSENGWKKVNEESKIQVYLKPSSNKYLDIMKGVGLVDGPPEKIAYILLDSTQKKKLGRT